MKKISIFYLIIFIISITFFTTGCIEEINTKESSTNSNELSTEKPEKETTTKAAESSEKNIEEKTPDTYETTESKNRIMFYNHDVNFAFIYPQDNLTLSSDQYIRSDYGDMLLSIKISKIENLMGADGYDRETAEKDRQELSGGSFGQDIDFVYEPSKTVLKIGDVNVKDFIVFGRYDVCDVTFERKAIFYNNDYQVIISLKGDKDKIIESMSEYFTVDNENCGNLKVWDFDKQKEFYEKIVTNQASAPVQQWYNTFESITELLQINDFKGASAGYSRIIDKRMYEQDKDLNYIISVAYPELQPAVNGDLNNTLNNFIHNDTVLPTIDAFKSELQEMKIQDEDIMAFSYLLIIDYSIAMYNDNAVSLSINLYPYTGGAHGMYYFQTYSYDLVNNKIIELEDIFKPEFDYMAFLSEFCYKDIVNQLENMDVQPDFEWIKKGTDPVFEDNYSQFLVTPEGLIIKFLAYQVAPGAAGDLSVKIPYVLFKENINPASIIYKIVKN